MLAAPLHGLAGAPAAGAAAGSPEPLAAGPTPAPAPQPVSPAPAQASVAFALPRLLIRYSPKAGLRVLAAPQGRPAPSSPVDMNFVSRRAYDSTNNWLRIENTGGQRGVHTPSDANQVFSSIFDSANNAIHVTCLSGCGATFGTDILGVDSSHQKVVGWNGIPLAASVPANGQAYQYSSTQNQWIPTTVVNATRNVNTSGPLTGGGNLGSDLTLGFASQSAATVLAGPASGSGAPTFRALRTGDLPALPSPGASALGGAKTVDCTGTGHILKLDSTGTFTCSTDSGGNFGTDINPIDTTHQKVVGLQTIPLASTVPSSGQCLGYNGTQWAPAPCGGSPGSANMAVQFNSSGSFGGDTANFSYDPSAHNVSLTGTLTAGGFATSGNNNGCLALNEAAANGIQGILLCAPSSVPTTTTWNWPAADGTNGQVLATSGTGVLSWSTPGTVMSVGLSMPSWLSVANSPVTSSGTLTVSAAGSQTTHQVIGTGTGSSFGPMSLTAADLPGLPGLNGLLGIGQINATGTASSSTFLRGDGSWSTPGTVTSVGLSTPSWLSVANSPVTSSGTLTVSAAGSQTTHQVIGTGTGSSFGPMTLTAADLPALPSLNGLMAISQINATGTASSSTYLRGDGTWSTPTGGFTAGGDLSGTSTSQTVAGIQGKAVDSSVPTVGQAPRWSASASKYVQTSPGDNLAFIDNGTSGSRLDFDPNDKSTFFIREEFGGGTTTSGQVGETGFGFQTIGAAPTAAKLSGAIPHLGVYQFTTTATANQGTNVGYGGNTPPLGNLSANTNWGLWWIFALNQTTLNRFRIGLNDGGIVPVAVNDISLRFDQGLGTPDTVWTLEACAASTCSTSTALGAGGATVAPDTNWHDLHIYSTIAGEVWFQLDSGATVCLTAAASGGCAGAGTAINNAHIPTAGMEPGAILTTTTTGTGDAVGMQLDFMAFKMRGLSR